MEFWHALFEDHREKLPRCNRALGSLVIGAFEGFRGRLPFRVPFAFHGISSLSCLLFYTGEVGLTSGVVWDFCCRMMMGRKIRRARRIMV